MKFHIVKYIKNWLDLIFSNLKNNETIETMKKFCFYMNDKYWRKKKKLEKFPTRFRIKSIGIWIKNFWNIFLNFYSNYGSI